MFHNFLNLFNFGNPSQYKIILKTNKTNLSGFTKNNNYSLELTAYENENLFNVIQNFNNYRKNQINQFMINNKIYSLYDLQKIKIYTNLIIYV